jgi:hypothetical protein
MTTGNVKDPATARLIGRREREAEQDVRRSAERCSQALYSLLAEEGLRALSRTLATRAAVVNDPSRADDDREIAYDFIVGLVKDAIYGGPAARWPRMELVLGDDELLGGSEVDRV